MRDHELSVDVRTGADAIDEEIDTLTHIGGRFGRNGFEQHRERARVLQRERVFGETLDGGERFSLDAITA